MAIKQLIALCLVFAVAFVSASPVAEADAEASADAYHGYFGGYGHRFGGYQHYRYGYQKRPFFYKPRIVTSAPVIKKYTYRVLPEIEDAPVGPYAAPEELFVVSEPEPVVRQAEPIFLPEPEPLVELFVVPEPEELLYQAEPVLVSEPEPLLRLQKLIVVPEPEILHHQEELILVPEPEPLVSQEDQILVVPEPVMRQAELEVVPELEPLVPQADLIVISEPDLVVKSNPVPVLQEAKSTFTFKPVAAVPEDHISAPVDRMVAPILPPAPIERTEEIVPVFENDIDVIGPAPEESFKVAPQPTPELSIVEVSENDIELVIKPVIESDIPALEVRQERLEVAPFELPAAEAYENDFDVIEPTGPAVQAIVSSVPDYIAPVQAPAAIEGVIASQYHAQDEFGNVVYGYSNPNSAKSEQRDGNGNVIGAYSYLDDTGFPKHVSYIADEFGFRITNANNFPIDINNPV